MAADPTQQEQLKQAWAKFEARMKQIQMRVREALRSGDDSEREKAIQALREQMKKQP